MKRIRWMALLLLATSPAWPAAKKITVGELKDMLLTMHQQGKSDQDVANALKQVQLTEELTRAMMNSLVPAVPGQLSTEQIYVLEARSAMLAPPATDIPTTPAPDAAGQQALLTKAGAMPDEGVVALTSGAGPFFAQAAKGRIWAREPKVRPVY